MSTSLVIFHFILHKNDRTFVGDAPDKTLEVNLRTAVSRRPRFISVFNFANLLASVDLL